MSPALPGDIDRLRHAASHDFRAPLRAILVFSGLLKEQLAGARENTAVRVDMELLEHLVDAGERLNRLVEGMVAFLDAGYAFEASEPVDLQSEVDRAWQALKSEWAPLEGQLNNRALLPLVRLPRSKLSVILKELLSNAVKFHQPHQPPQVEVRAGIAEQELQVQVQDLGIGLEKRHVPRVFELYQRLHTRDEYPGLGLGLALVEKGVSSMGGRIEVESAVNVGTTFTLSFPIGGPQP